jgi:hypothetical protein
VRHLLTVGPTFPAEDLPSGFGAQQVDVAPANAVAAVEPVFDPFGHSTMLEHVFDCINCSIAPCGAGKVTSRWLPNDRGIGSELGVPSSGWTR